MRKGEKEKNKTNGTKMKFMNAHNLVATSTSDANKSKINTRMKNKDDDTRISGQGINNTELI